MMNDPQHCCLYSRLLFSKVLKKENKYEKDSSPAYLERDSDSMSKRRHKLVNLRED